MCGLAGFLNYGGVPASLVNLTRMTNAIYHRGPDSEGHFIDKSFALGHRRLSVIDLSEAGSQPMATEDGRFVLAYNGEIYNFNELRIQLKSFGYTFRSRTDSEVVLKALVHWGVDALKRFNGMFALALWDKKERELLLARDRYGIKPLYFTKSGHNFVFASEVKAIIASNLYNVGLQKEALLEYLTFQNIFTSQTLFKDVNLLEQGSFLKIDMSSFTLFKNRYWDYAFEETSAVVDENEYIEELDRLFSQAVNRQLVGDVDIGAYLSGGIDSGSVTAIAASQIDCMKSFTCGFDLNSASGVELNYDEREAAEFMSYKFKTEHYEMVLKAGDMERIMPKLIYHLEDLRVGQSYPNFYASQLASKFVKVVLSGAGGDELFAGYPWRYYKATSSSTFDDYIDSYFGFWQRLLPNHYLKKLFMPIANEIKEVNTLDIFKNVFKSETNSLTRPVDYINHSLYFEAKTFLHGLLLVEDKLSSAHSLETRLPFLDNDLVDFAMKLPVKLKLGNLTDTFKVNENEPGPKASKYYQRTHDGKLIMRKVMKNYVPDSIVNRKKQGFSAPDSSWYKGESINYVKNIFYQKDSSLYDFLDRNIICSLIEEHIQGKENRRLLIWSLISLDSWLKCFFS